jgi:hypothetical protein
MFSPLWRMVFVLVIEKRIPAVAREILVRPRLKLEQDFAYACRWTNRGTNRPGYTTFQESSPMEQKCCVPMIPLLISPSILDWFDRPVRGGWGPGSGQQGTVPAPFHSEFDSECLPGDGSISCQFEQK